MKLACAMETQGIDLSDLTSGMKVSIFKCSMYLNAMLTFVVKALKSNQCHLLQPGKSDKSVTTLTEKLLLSEELMGTYMLLLVHLMLAKT